LRDDDRVSVTGPATGGTPLRLLIDSNFYITLEPYGGALEAGQGLAAEVVRLATEQGHRLVVHPASRDDLLEATDPRLRAQRLAELAKYPQLVEGPIPGALTNVLGLPSEGSNDHRDLRILAALHHKAAAYLITNDGKLRRRAAHVGLGERVLTLNDAVEMLRQLAPTMPTPPPRVRVVQPYTLDADEPIFASLREDYPEFDDWLDAKVRADLDNRDCLVIEEDGCYAALAIVKQREPDCAYRFPQPVTKVATFKVDTDYLGSKYGELLLKSLFAAAHERGAASMYVEVLPRHEGLVDLLRTFGFAISEFQTERGELVMVKHLHAPAGAKPLPALEHHIAYGPPAIAGSGNVFVIPILPVWHRQLFPDAPDEQPRYEQLELLTAPQVITHPWGNALRKAYLSNSPSNQISAGDTLLFYRSHGSATVTAVGTVEETLRSRNPVEVMAFVGRRTVYTPSEIEQMCRSVRGVLAILFRQDRFIDPPWHLAELQANDVVTSWPQSITNVREGGAQWVHDRLAE
jgi:GNAT superfamily N-acetyltransferase